MRGVIALGTRLSSRCLWPNWLSNDRQPACSTSAATIRPHVSSSLSHNADIVTVKSHVEPSFVLFGEGFYVGGGGLIDLSICFFVQNSCERYKRMFAASSVQCAPKHTSLPWPMNGWIRRINSIL